MRSPDENGIEKLERALTEAYRSRPDILTDRVEVARRVMHDIQHGAGERNRWTPSVLLDELVWRTATIAAAVVLVVTLLTVQLVRSGASENASLLAEEFETAPLFVE